jgi:hypothetical protein
MKLINIKKATPMFTGIITTCDRYTEEEATDGGVVNDAMLGRIKEIQTVISPSEQCKARGINQDDVLALSFEKYKKVRKSKNLDYGIDENYSNEYYYEMPVMPMDGRECLFIDISDIELKIDEFEWVDEPKENLIVK